MIEEEIAEMILEEATKKQLNKETASSDLVAAIHSILMRVGLLSINNMKRIRHEERTKKMG